MAMQKPHEFVFNQVQCKWACERSKGFFTKLIELGEIKAVAIDIIETERFDERRKLCTGEILNRWRYDDTGLRYIPKHTDIDSHKVEYCKYCINKEQKKLMVVWIDISKIESRGKDIHYSRHGASFEIVESNGVEDFKVISVWMT
jgi:hypothetical protein